MAGIPEVEGIRGRVVRNNIDELCRGERSREVCFLDHGKEYGF